MNGPDQFEERLERQPVRPVPPAWRAEILAAAHSATPARPSPHIHRRSLLSTLNSQLSTLFWPHPKAWAGLAAAWLLVLGLNYATREPVPQEMARQAVPPSRQLRELLHQQEQLFAELAGPLEQPAAEPPKPPAPRPHSQRREEFLNT